MARNGTLFGFVALADIFVCAIAMVLIMLLFARNGRSVPMPAPTAHLAFDCRKTEAGGFELYQPGEPATPAHMLDAGTVKTMLNRQTPDAGLSLRMQVTVDHAAGDCAERLGAIAEQLNEAFDKATADAPGRLLQLDIVRSPAATGPAQ